jgi:hypothetical protein
LTGDVVLSGQGGAGLAGVYLRSNPLTVSGGNFTVQGASLVGGIATGMPGTAATGAIDSPGNPKMMTPMTTQFENQDSNRLADQVAYDPNNLLDSLIEKLHLKNDAALSRALEVAPPVISKIRHRRLPVGASLLIRMHEVSDLSIRELRVLMGDRREKFRISDKQFKPK